MRDITVRTINKYQTEVVVEGRRVVLTDMNKVNAAKARRRKISNFIINTILVIAFSMLMFWGIWLFFTHDEGHWEADYVTEEGQLIDIDGDGDCYHWVDPSN